ncbi:MAG: hypothetical protein KIPDCIKN_03834 [Haliscomenobacter sp.]|jgi:hypothetical protein|nr:hypothetical protein [Haliscomenobacter sp.]
MRKLTEKMGKTVNPFAVSIIVAAFFLVFTGFHTVKESLSLSPGDVLITEQSKLSLSGTSNVNKFTCACNQKFSPLTIGATASSNRSQIAFEHTVLKLTTNKLDCGQKIMNKDMYRTLKADEYPYISIELKKAQFPVGVTIDDCAEWVELDAETVITIAGNARRVPLKVKARNLSAGRFQFRSAQALKMTDFGIQPPTAMMGAIKVRDSITIQFDLIVAVSSAGEVSAS